MKSSEGFTAVEMMVVMAIIAITSSIALVNYKEQLPRHNLKKAGRNIVSRLRYQRQSAITQHKTLLARVHFGKDSASKSSDSGTWDLFESELPAYVRFGYPEEISETPKRGRLSPAALDGVAFQNNRIAFEPNGTVQGLGGYLYLTNAPLSEGRDKRAFQYETVAIAVNITGHVQLYKWENGQWK